jgi:DNA-binding protein H-NS
VIFHSNEREFPVNLRKLSLKQLDDLSAKIEARRARMQRENAGNVRRQVMDAIRAAGLSVADIFGGDAPKTARRGRPPKAAAPAAPAAAPAAKGPKKKAKAAAPAKRGRPAGRKGRGRGRKADAVKPGSRAVKGVTYANPSDSKQRWSGYGKRPGWFLKAIAAGKSEGDLRAK